MGAAHRTAVEVRPIDDGDLELVALHVASGVRDKHRERMAMQRRGEADYLVAWRQGLPVGHLLLKWTGPSHEPMASGLRDCAHIEDLFVNPDHRSRGIGSQLLEAAEDLARRRGHSRIGLGVGLGNPRARALYERRGYRDSGLGTYRHGTNHGERQVGSLSNQEVDLYLIKEL